MASIDFEAFKERVSLEQVVKALQLNIVRFHPGWRRGPCPVCRHGDERACNINWERSIWYCHRCHKGGGQITFAAYILRLNSFQAVKEVCRRLGIDVPWKSRVRTRRRHRDRDGTIIDDDDDEDVLT